MYHSLLSRLNVIQKTIVDVLRDVLAYRRHNSTKVRTSLFSLVKTPSSLFTYVLFCYYVPTLLLNCLVFNSYLLLVRTLKDFSNCRQVNGFLLIPAAIQFNFFPSFLEKLKPMLVHLETFIKNKWNVSE